MVDAKVNAEGGWAARREWLAGLVVLLFVGAGLIGYMAWNAYANRRIDYATALRSSPAWTAYQEGLRLIGMQRWNQAIDAFERALGSDSSNALIYNELAKAHFAQGDYVKAAVTCEDGVRQAPGSPELYYTLGLARFHLARYDDARQALLKSLELWPENPDAHLWLGNTYLALARSVAGGAVDVATLQEAVDEFRTAIDINANAASYHAALGEALYAQRDLQGAKDAYATAVKLERRNPRYQEAYGKLALEVDALDEAEDAYRAALQLGSSSGEAHFGLGVVYSKRDQTTEAITELRAAVAANPFHVEAHERLAELLSRIGDQAGADQELAQVEQAKARGKQLLELQQRLQREPNNVELMNTIANQLAREGKLDEAATMLKRITIARPDFIDAHYQLGGVYFNKGMWAEALQTFLLVEKKQPGYRRVNYYLARTNEKVGRLKVAAHYDELYKAQQAAGSGGEDS
jgi:tetratricopeptide (TPR) repeat protein